MYYFYCHLDCYRKKEQCGTIVAICVSTSMNSSAMLIFADDNLTVCAMLQTLVVIVVAIVSRRICYQQVGKYLKSTIYNSPRQTYGLPAAASSSSSRLPKWVIKAESDWHH